MPACQAEESSSNLASPVAQLTLMVAHSAMSTLSLCSQLRQGPEVTCLAQPPLPFQYVLLLPGAAGRGERSHGEIPPVGAKHQ